jgi:hypothetical protein
MTDIFANELAGMTMVGAYSDTYPYESGNCFSVIASDGKEYKIVNFAAENFEALHQFDCKLPVKIRVLSERHAVIHDERIPDDWYQGKFCEVCCPERLLPIPQQLRIEREKAQGFRQSYGERSYKIDFEKKPKWECRPVTEF